jgi:heptaprenyl diphosphate synthase
MTIPTQPTDRDAIAPKAALLLTAMVLTMLEMFIPRIPLFPWLKPGLANCVTLVWIVRYGAVDTLLFTLLRVWIAGFYFGFSFVTLALSVCGGLVATVGMACLWQVFGSRRLMGIVGIAVAGAVLHNVGQLAAVYVLMARNAYLFWQLPIMGLASVLFGTVTGVLAVFLWRISEASSDVSRTEVLPPRSQPVSARNAIASVAVLTVSVGLVFVEDLRVLTVGCLAATTAVQIMLRGSWSALIRPLRAFWMLFAFIGIFHAFFTYGRVVQALPFLTWEGLTAATVQWLRLWIWLQLSFVLTRLRFHTVLFSALRRLFPRHRDTLYAGMLAVEYLPLLFEGRAARPRLQWASMVRHPLKGLTEAVESAFRAMVALVAGTQERGIAEEGPAAKQDVQDPRARP